MSRAVNPRLGVILEAARITRGLSVRGAAKAAGITPAYWWRLERGQRRPSAATAAELARVLRLDEYGRDLLAAETGCSHLGIPG